jgi:hypothetical protein
MSYEEVLANRSLAISISESPDMASLGLSDEHVKDAMAEVARHMLALGMKLVYGGDLRQHGFSELLFELVARHRPDLDETGDRTGVYNFLAWPVHIGLTFEALEMTVADLAGSAELVLLDEGGRVLTIHERQRLSRQQATEKEWSAGLTAMRRTMLSRTDARVVLGGRVDRFKGAMPGIAEETLLSLGAKQPLFVMGGFGGCARDIAETLGLVDPWAGSRPGWLGRDALNAYSPADLNNGLTPEENMALARTPHVDQAIILILRGLLRVANHKPREA